MECYQEGMNYLLENSPLHFTRYLAGWKFYRGLVSLKQGQIDSTKSRLAEIKSLIPQLSSPAQKSGSTHRSNLLYGEILLVEGKTDSAITIFESVPSQEVPSGLSYPDIIFCNVPFSRDGLARAYLKAGDQDRAIAEYERLTTFDPNAMDRYLIHPKYHYRLAKLYEEKGLPDKAIQRYEKLIEIWKDADEDLPELIDARARYVKLKKGQ